VLAAIAGEIALVSTVESSQDAEKHGSGSMDRRHRLPGLKLAVALGALAGAALLDARTAVRADWAQTAPWCAALGGRDGGNDCGYYTFEQCMATARGLSSNCQPNPWALAAPNPPPPRRTRK
jgi:Protein of unknown function (DUF3551)